MQHIDEGLLNAYLDDALDAYPPEDARWVQEHLESCGECELRLEEQRSIRAAAHTLLDGAAPAGVEFASLEALRAEAHGATPAEEGDPAAAMSRARGPGVFVQLSWAASILVAVGAGWMARDLRVAADPTVGFEQLRQVATPQAEPPLASEGEAEDQLKPAADAEAEAEEGVPADGRRANQAPRAVDLPESIQLETLAVGQATERNERLAEEDVADVVAEEESARRRAASESRVEPVTVPTRELARSDALAGAAAPPVPAAELGAEFRDESRAADVSSNAVPVPLDGGYGRLAPTLPVELAGLGPVQRYVEVLEDGRLLEFWLVPGSGALGDALGLSEVRDYFERAGLPSGWNQIFRVREEGVLVVRSGMSVEELGAQVDRLLPPG